VKNSVVWAAAAMCLGWMAAACQGLEEAPRCAQIPSGGCPASGGGTCDDQACASIYRCTDQGWELREHCAPTDAGAADVSDGGSENDRGCGQTVLIPGTSDCDSSELQDTDCPVQVAYGCAASACLTGCTDFFVCRTGMWLFAGYCDDANTLAWVDGI
jgi:hypothetical protein